MRQIDFDFSGHGGVTLPAVLWLPEEAPKAVLQITHGMTEHMGRYADFAQLLCRGGVAVAGFDLRGHGKNPGNPQIASFGEGGWEATLQDMRLFFGLLRQRFPGVPHILYGFSLGSFLLRDYLAAYPEGVSGAIIAGTGHQPGWLLSVMIPLVGSQIRKAGFDGTTDLVRKLSFGTYNESFRPNRTTADWLCGDEAALQAYLADPLVRSDISAGLFRDLLAAMKRTGTQLAYGSLPILLLSGEDDPVGGRGEGVCRLYKGMEKAGARQVSLCLIPQARHDFLHEEASGAADRARRAIVDWMVETW